MRALTWNLYHGRSPKPAGRSLLKEFAAALAGWEWDVALLQEVPPWWPPRLAVAAGAECRCVLTSRNLGLPVRRAISSRNPDLLKANGGGCNAILVRGAIGEHRRVRLTWRPERRMAHGVRLADGSWAVNVHASRHRDDWALRDTLKALEAAREWVSGAPLLFGGDLNLHGSPVLPGLVRLGGNHVDHLFTSAGRTAQRIDVLDRGRLSDHAPVAVTL
jgi:endonuclease/exonuclease/phosphatase family metal-dependent hydrolase